MPRDPLENPAAYQRFVTAAVERYDGDGIDDGPGGVRITHWQVGNETPRFVAADDGVARYVRFFTLTAEAARAADPNARMVLIASVDSTRMDALHREVIPQLAEAGVRFDAIDLHHWGRAGDVEMRAVPEYQRLLAQVGVADVELWSTEHGTYVGRPVVTEGECQPACAEGEVCAPIPPNGRCVPRCQDDARCLPAQPSCDPVVGLCGLPEQSERDQARSLVLRYVVNRYVVNRYVVNRYVVNRDLGVRRILWNNLVAWHCFAGRCGSYFDRLGLVSGGFLDGEDEGDRGRPRLAWFAYQRLSRLTDTPSAERLGRVDIEPPSAHVHAYRDRATGAVGWIAWSDPPASVALPAEVPLRITGFITDAEGMPTREEVAAARDGLASVDLDADPVWIAP